MHVTVFYYHSISRMLSFSLCLSFFFSPSSLDYDFIVNHARIFIEIFILLHALMCTHARMLRDNAAFPLQYLCSIEIKENKVISRVRAIC